MVARCTNQIRLFSVNRDCCYCCVLVLFLFSLRGVEGEYRAKDKLLISAVTYQLNYSGENTSVFHVT